MSRVGMRGEYHAVDFRYDAECLFEAVQDDRVTVWRLVKEELRGSGTPSALSPALHFPSS